MAVVNITVENDADFYRQFAYQLVDGTPINLTGNTLRMGVRRHAEDAIEEIVFTTENGALTINDPLNGMFTLRIVQAQLLQLPVGAYEHSLVRLIGTTERYRIWSGTLTNNPGASR
jgi:hypothetical protein